LLARISIVVPIFNVDRYLQACLDSLSSQTFRDFEAILVDDGSTDNSPQIAAAHAAKDARFRVITQANGGLSRARNAGIDAADGEFLGFLDSDDVVARHAYEMMLVGLDRSGSDFATANVRRLTTRGLMSSPLHERALPRRRRRTHIRRNPELIYDTTAWNKVFRREFWDHHNLLFPPGMLYEDMPVMTRAHFLAKKIDVYSDPVFYWRRRSGNELSITQQRSSLDNLVHRMAALASIDEFLSSSQKPWAKRIHDRKVVTGDILLYFNALLRAEPEFQEQFVVLVNDFLDGIDRRIIRQTPAIDRLKYYFLRRRMLPELLAVLAFQESAGRDIEPVRVDGKWFAANYPFRDDPALNVPSHLYRLRQELEVKAGIENLRWEGATLVLDGYAYISALDIGTEKDADLRLMVVPGDKPVRAPLKQRVMTRLRRQNVPVSIERVRRPQVTETSGQSLHCYDWAGFHARIDTDRLLRSPDPDWSVHVDVHCSGLTRRGSFHPIGEGSRKPDARTLPDGRQIVVTFNDSGLLRLRIQQPPTTALDMRAIGDDVEVRGTVATRYARGDSLALLLRRREGASERSFPVTLADPPDPGSGTRGFSSRIAVSDLLEEREIADRIAQTERYGGGLHWDVFLHAPKSKPVRVAIGPAWVETSLPFGEREVIARATRRNLLTLTERIILPVVTDIDVVDSVITLSGRYPVPETEPFTGVLRRPGTMENYAVSTRRTEDRFEVTIDLARVDRIDGTGHLQNGRWSIGLRDRHGEIIGMKLDHGLFRRLPPPATLGSSLYTITTAGYDSLILRAQPNLSAEERGPYRQRLLQTQHYPQGRQRPLRDNLYLESWHGKQYSDSPRGIYDALLDRGGNVNNVVWMLRDPVQGLRGNPRVTQYLSTAHYDALATSRIVAVNDALPPWFERRPEQTVLQTWHGSPLKRIGFDIDKVAFASIDYQDTLVREVEKWTHLISPAPCFTEIMRQAFHFEGEMLETGYPRNDIFFSPQAADIRSSVRARLGIPDGKVAVLYAPTWRDDMFYGRGRYRFQLELDLERARAALGSDVVFLIRTHHLIAEAVDLSGFDDIALNVSGWPDVQELYLAADILVTDYSSVFFDFAITGRPIIFFAYDLENYRDQLRGFYLDFEAIAPGPIVRTSDGVIEAIADTATWTSQYTKRYAEFRRTYNAWDDGHASARVLDHLASTGALTGVLTDPGRG
jgi:CDP-glycerol glycerophosphotransferase